MGGDTTNGLTRVDPTEVDVVWVPIPFSQAEYRRLSKRSARMGAGTLWAAAREAMGLQERPTKYRRGKHGLQRPQRAWDEKEAPA